MATELRAACPLLNVTTAQVHKWAQNDAIPAKYHHHLVAVGRARGFDINAELIAALHAPERSAA